MSSKQKSKLTVEKLKTYKGFEDLTQAQAEEALANIEKCARFFFDLYISKKLSTHEK